MDLVSNDKILDEINDLQKEEGSDFVGKLDLNLAASKDEEGNEICSHGNATWNDDNCETEMDLNQQELQGYPMLPSDSSGHGAESPQMKPSSVSPPESPVTYCLHDEERETNEPPSLVQSESYDNDAENRSSKHDQERLLSPPKDNLSCGEIEAIGFADYSGKSSSPLQKESFCNETKTEDTLFSVITNVQNEDMVQTRDSCGGKSFPHDREAEKYSVHFSENAEFEKMEPAYESENHHYTGKDQSPSKIVLKKENFQCLNKMATDNGEIEAASSDLHSPVRFCKQSASLVKLTSLSPEISPSVRPSPGKQLPSPTKGVQESSHSAGLSRQRHSPSPERPTMDGTGVTSHECLSPSVKRASTPLGRASKRDSQRRDGSPYIHLSTSPRRKRSPPGHRRQDRSASRSPTRRKVSPSGRRRDYRDRSQSRSPYAQNRYRSPRRRHSPRRKSSCGYHSRRGSPRRRPWSPPPNRSTGVGRPGKNLFVAGFSFVTTERDLERKFSRFGRVTGVRIVRDKRSGDSRGFGFLSLERDEDADAAIQALDQTEWNGRIVLVEKSKTSVH